MGECHLPAHILSDIERQAPWDAIHEVDETIPEEVDQLTVEITVIPFFLRLADHKPLL